MIKMSTRLLLIEANAFSLSDPYYFSETGLRQHPATVSQRLYLPLDDPEDSILGFVHDLFLVEFRAQDVAELIG